ncbi:MAG: thioredoxin-like (seleno)protein SaoT [Syntrophobacteraceae bacterium]
MPKVQVEFINTCPCCDEYGQIIRSAAARYGEDIEVRIYYAGKDLDYVRKYGPVTKGTMIINGKKKFETLSKSIIEKAIAEAINP